MQLCHRLEIFHDFPFVYTKKTVSTPFLFIITGLKHTQCHWRTSRTNTSEHQIQRQVIWHHFRTRSPVTMVNIYDCHTSDLITPLSFNDNTDLHCLSTVSFVSVVSFLTSLTYSAERICGITYHIPFSPDYSEVIHTKYTIILPWVLLFVYY